MIVNAEVRSEKEEVGKLKRFSILDARFSKMETGFPCCGTLIVAAPAVLLRRTTQNETQGSPLRSEGLRYASRVFAALRGGRRENAEVYATRIVLLKESEFRIISRWIRLRTYPGIGRHKRK